ncbi:MAG: hypothetical protein KCHDKBKB_02178 [Elusimicrobia bacterium]|nr:hypothetical protein [Elusimicrobiota bacterium]
MDDVSYQEWSDKLGALRKKRQAAFDELVQEKATSFTPAEFYEGGSASLEGIIEAWFEFEKKSWETTPPENPRKELEATVLEMQSIIDFEVEAIERDRTSVMSRITWDPAEISSAESAFRDFSEDLKKRFEIKLKEIIRGSEKKKTMGDLPTRSSGGSSTGNALAYFSMFFIGLLLGAGPSIYYMNSSKESHRKFQEERSQILGEQRALEDSMGILHEKFSQLALGKGKTIPELEKRISEIKVKSIEARRQIESEYQRDREKILRRTPAGNAQDKALGNLEDVKDSRLRSIVNREESDLAPLVTQLNILNELIR